MLRNFVYETSSAPGTSTTINLGGTVTGRRAWSVFSSGAIAYYFMTDGTISEWGIGTYTSGTPNTLARTTVIGNSAGTTTRLNFTGSTQVYNELPAEKVVYLDNNGATSVPGAFGSASLTTGALGCTSISCTGAFAVAQGNGISMSTFPALLITQTGGTSTTAINVNLSNTGSNFLGFQYTGGNIGSITTNGSSVAYNTTSDYRAKTVYGPADAGGMFDAVPVYDAEMRFGERRPMFLAHELQAAAPWAVSGEKDATCTVGNVTDAVGVTIQVGVPQPGEMPEGCTWTATGTAPVYQQVDHQALIPAMWAEIRALRARVAALEGAAAK